MNTVKVELTEEDVNFLNQVLGSAEVNGTRVGVQGLVTVLQKLNTPVTEPEDIRE